MVRSIVRLTGRGGRLRTSLPRGWSLAGCVSEFDDDLADGLPAGEAVVGLPDLPFAREILAQEAAAHAALGHGQVTATGTLRFTAPSTFAQLYIAPLLPAFLERHPGIDLDLRLTDLEMDLIQGSFDLALRNAVLADSSLKARKLADDSRVL